MPRLGERTTDHSIMALVGDDPVKVVCRTCNFEHKFRGNKTGKKELTAAEAFNKLLASANSQLGVEDKKPKKKR